MSRFRKGWCRGALALLSVCMVCPVGARDLVLAEVHPPEHVIVKSESLMAAKLAEATKGAVTIQIKHSGQMGNETEAWNKVRNGSLDIARVNLGGLVADVPSAKLLSLPYLFRSRDHMWRVLGGDFGQRIAADVEKSGAVVLAYYDSGTRSFYTTKRPIRTRDDFEGLRIRVQPSPVYQDLITQLGGTPVTMQYDKVAEAFKKGEIDGAENNMTSYVSSGHYKVARYLSLDEHSSVPEVLLISKKAWGSLTGEQQAALRQAAEDSSESMKKLWAEAEAQSLAQAKKEGVTILDKHQVALAGIEGFAVKLYSKYVTNSQDLDAVLSILRTK